MRAIKPLGFADVVFVKINDGTRPPVFCKPPLPTWSIRWMWWTGKYRLNIRSRHPFFDSIKIRFRDAIARHRQPKTDPQKSNESGHGKRRDRNVSGSLSHAEHHTLLASSSKRCKVQV
jgi:hypothetical protein